MTGNPALDGFLQRALFFNDAMAKKAVAARLSAAVWSCTGYIWFQLWDRAFLHFSGWKNGHKPLLSSPKELLQIQFALAAALAFSVSLMSF
jgi:hypothetical protein